MPTTETRDPDEIEREIRSTQREMSNTVDRLEEQMTPRNLLNGLLDKADENDIDARYVLDVARRNPIALGMIAFGGLWLVSDSDARMSSLKPGGKGRSDGEWEEDAHHRGYVQHMAGVEPRPEEDEAAYRRRRDCARASYLMIEQRHDEDEKSFRQRLDQATERMRERREQLAEKAREARTRTREGAGRITGKAKGAYYENPLLGGLAAALAGAIAGSTLPATRAEEERIGPMGAKALDEARNKAREKKDEAVEKADRKMHEGSGPDGHGRQEEQIRAEVFDTA
jgi:hypothetical protein